MDDICNFISQKNIEKSLYFIHFVYETNIKKLQQPFNRSDFYICLVSKGTGIFKSEGKETRLKKGDLFFTFPHQIYYINETENFTYLYLSFNGENASTLLSSLNIDKDNYLFENFEHLLQFWMDSIIRVNRTNSILLAESVLTHTLSYLGSDENEQQTNKFDYVISYINHNFTSKDMSLKKIAGIFFYNEKYLSSLFIRKTGTRFSEYLNNLRIQYAQKLIKSGKLSISEIAFKCGYSDYFYFSKVFKKIVGITPTQYAKKI